MWHRIWTHLISNFLPISFINLPKFDFMLPFCLIFHIWLWNWQGRGKELSLLNWSFNEVFFRFLLFASSFFFWSALMAKDFVRLPDLGTSLANSLRHKVSANFKAWSTRDGKQRLIYISQLRRLLLSSIKVHTTAYEKEEK